MMRNAVVAVTAVGLSVGGAVGFYWGYSEMGMVAAVLLGSLGAAGGAATALSLPGTELLALAEEDLGAAEDKATRLARNPLARG